MTHEKKNANNLFCRSAYKDVGPLQLRRVTTYDKLESNTNDGLAQAFSLVVKDTRYSRIYLMATALLFAVLFGAFWHMPHSTALIPEQSAQSINYSELAQTNSSNPEAIAVYKKKAIFSMAVADVHALKFMVFQH